MGLKIKNTISKLTYPNSGKYLVRFIDYDGTLLKEEWVFSGGTATPPIVKNTTYHYFFGWNIPYSNIQHDLDVAAIRNTIDNNSYIFLSFTIVTGKAPTLYLNKSDTTLMTIEWGDGNTTTTYGSGNLNFPHTYSNYSDRIIKVSTFSNYTFGNGTSTTPIIGTSPYVDCLVKLYLSTYIKSLSNYLCHKCISMTEISISSAVTSIGNYALSDSSSLKSVNIPNGVTSLGNYALYDMLTAICTTIPNSVTSFGTNALDEANFIKTITIPNGVIVIPNEMLYYCVSLESVYLPVGITSIGLESLGYCYSLKTIIIQNGLTSLGVGSFTNCYNLKSITLPPTLTSIGALVFHFCNNLLKYVFYSTSPPTLSNINAFDGITRTTKIYVPDASVTAYKTATNWLTYANYIYPISQIPI